MEALTEQLRETAAVLAVPAPVSLSAAIAVVRAAVAAAPDQLAMAGYVEAAEFAAQVEELSRSVDYAQILSAGAVDRTRTQAITHAAATRATRTWTTGWDNGTETLNETDTAAETHADWPATPAPALCAGSPADDGCKTTAEFLRLRLRIGLGEAKRRLHLAHAILPETTLTGDRIPPAREHLAAAFTPATTADPGTEDPTAPAFPAGPGRCSPPGPGPSSPPPWTGSNTTPHHRTSTGSNTTSPAPPRPPTPTSSPASPAAGPTPSTPTAPNPPKKPSATPKAHSSANPATACTTSKSSPPPTNTNSSPPS